MSHGQGVELYGSVVEPRTVETAPRFHVANRIEQAILRSLGFAGICWPWRRIALLPKWYDHQTLRRHELIHLEQIDRHGPIIFTILWCWYTLTRGYWGNPFELEAYRRQTQPDLTNQTLGE